MQILAPDGACDADPRPWVGARHDSARPVGGAPRGGPTGGSRVLHHRQIPMMETCPEDLGQRTPMDALRAGQQVTDLSVRSAEQIPAPFGKPRVSGLAIHPLRGPRPPLRCLTA